MPDREPAETPNWADQERAGDMEWIRENLHIFWPAAQLGYQTVGRGAIVVDTTSRPTGEGHPFGYLDQAAIEQAGDEDTRRLVKEYEPWEEFVTALFKPQERTSSYRLRLVAREELANRVELAEPVEFTSDLAEAEFASPRLWWQKPFSVASVCREDLQGILTNEEIASLSDDDMEIIADRMSDAYRDSGGYWESLEIMARHVLEIEETTTREAQPPDLETLMAWSDEGYCEATDGCVVEPDGTCPHGHPSWLLELGLI